MKYEAPPIRALAEEDATFRGIRALKAMTFGLSCLIRGSWLAWETGWVAAEAEHCECDEGLWGAEPERDSGNESDLGVHGLDAAVGQTVLDRGEDRGPVFQDRALQADERGDAAAAGPADPLLERVWRLVGGELEYEPEPFFQEVPAVQGRVGLRDPVELGLLMLGEVLGVLPQRVPGTLQAVAVNFSDPDAKSTRNLHGCKFRAEMTVSAGK